jgi:20S proteasome alpha/beta subunit
MECSFALTGKDYVLVAADTTAARSIVKMKVDEDKIKTLSPHLLMAYSGESGPFHALPLKDWDFGSLTRNDSYR